VSAQPCEAVVPLLAAGLNASVGLGADGSALAAPPVFDSVPPTAAIAGQSYQYAPSVRDPQNLATTLRLVGAPSGMVLGADRTVRWASPALGTHVVTVRADNGRAVADQRYDLVVGNGAQPLELGVALTPTVVNAGQTVNLVAFANGGRGSVCPARAPRVRGRPRGRLRAMGDRRQSAQPARLGHRIPTRTASRADGVGAL
jgi:hypothetical protein